MPTVPFFAVFSTLFKLQILVMLSKCLQFLFFSRITLCTLLWKQNEKYFFQAKILFFSSSKILFSFVRGWHLCHMYILHCNLHSRCCWNHTLTRWRHISHRPLPEDTYYTERIFVSCFVSQCVPYLVAMGSDPESAIRVKADQQLSEIDRRYPGFIQVRSALNVLNSRSHTLAVLF